MTNISVNFMGAPTIRLRKDQLPESGIPEHVIQNPSDRHNIDSQFIAYFENGSLVSKETVDTIRFHAQPILGREINATHENICDWNAEIFPHVIATQLACCLKTGKINEKEYFSLLDYLPFINSESYLFIHYFNQPQICLLSKRKNCPAIYAYKDGTWGFESVWDMDVYNNEKYDIKLYAVYQREFDNLTVCLACAEQTQFFSNIISAGKQGTATIGEFLKSVAPIRKEAPTRQPSVAGSGCIFPIMLFGAFSSCLFSFMFVLICHII